MNEHSFTHTMPAVPSTTRRAQTSRPPALPDKRDVILRAATRVFAQNGYLNLVGLFETWLCTKYPSLGG